MTTFCQVAYVKTYVQEVPWQRLHEVSKILIHSVCLCWSHSLFSEFLFSSWDVICCTFTYTCPLNCRTAFLTSTRLYVFLMGSAFVKLSSAEMVRENLQLPLLLCKYFCWGEMEMALETAKAATGLTAQPNLSRGLKWRIFSWSNFVLLDLWDMSEELI